MRSQNLQQYKEEQEGKYIWQNLILERKLGNITLNTKDKTEQLICVSCFVFLFRQRKSGNYGVSPEVAAARGLNCGADR